MKLLILISLISLFNNPIWGQRASIYGDTISAETARKHIKEGKLYLLVYGEFASIPYEKCEKKIWENYSCEVIHVSNYGVPEADEYNKVLFNHLDSLYGSNWRIEKDSSLNDCMTNNICGINAYEWHYNSFGQLPVIPFNHNVATIDSIGRCILENFYIDFFSKVKELDLYIILDGSMDKNESIENLEKLRCESIKSYLINLGVDSNLIEINNRFDDIDYCEFVIDCPEKQRKWNRVVNFLIDEE